MRLLAFALLTSLPLVGSASLADDLSFGNAVSPIDVYVFTDWQCPYCRKAEPAITAVFPSLCQEARVFFIDYPVHKPTYAYIPYNLSFLVNDKLQYIPLRDELFQFAKWNDNPTPEQMASLAAQVGAPFEPLDEEQLSAGTSFFRDMASWADVQSTPSVILYNRDTKRQVRLTDSSLITEENLFQGVESLRH